jgi:hypothetical protein
VFKGFVDLNVYGATRFAVVVRRVVDRRPA